MRAFAQPLEVGRGDHAAIADEHHASQRPDLDVLRGPRAAEAAHGHSRDGNPRNRQVLVGVVMVDQWPIAHHVSEVERAFANLKDVIELRPIYHRADPRVEAHIFVTALAFLLHRTVEKQLKAAGLDLSATEALRVLRTVRLVEFTLGRGQTKRSVTRGSTRAATILAALGITDLDPPTHPRGSRVPTVM